MNENIQLPSRQKMYLPKKKKQFPYLLFILALFLITLLIHSFVEPKVATAKTIEAKDCMTNSCVCSFLGEYVNGSEFADYCATTK